jgi:hypothetical protein
MSFGERLSLSRTEGRNVMSRSARWLARAVIVATLATAIGADEPAGRSADSPSNSSTDAPTDSSADSSAGTRPSPASDPPVDRPRGSLDLLPPRDRPGRADRADEGIEPEARRGLGQRLMHRPRPDFRSVEPPDDQEWGQILDFIRKHSPNRARIYDEMQGRSGERPALEGLRRRFAMRYRALRQVEQSEPQLYDFQLRQLEIEDSIFETLERLRHDRDNAELREQLSQRVRAFVSNNFEERAARLRSLRQRLEQEEQTLARDRETIDDLVKLRRERFVHDFRSLRERRPWASDDRPADGSGQPSQ